ncbi:MAG: hypothetical protein HYZ15_09655 [Sphingobacteriales bacterium]|nr:hypothetical protein [Sphingobacteriales bacterium]
MNKLDILSNMDNPGELEKMYRDNRAAFKKAFLSLYPELTGNKLAAFWYERLNYEGREISWGSSTELLFVVFLSLIAGFIAKIPDWFNLNDELFYQRNAGFIVFPLLTAYFSWRKKISIKKMTLAVLVFLTAVIFVNLLPADPESDTLVLTCIHLPLFLWAVLGFIFVGDHTKNHPERLAFLRYNGDMVIMTTLILIAGVLLSGITIGLFSVIGFSIEKFYFDHIGLIGLAASPIIGTYVTQTNPQLVNKVSPVIARLFSPLVLLMLVVYLAAILYSGKDPYNDRDFLVIFNLLLVGVMAIILFDIAETTGKSRDRAGSFILLALSLVTVIVNGIALSAILFRISSWGFTPNRLAVLGSNLLMLLNLLLITFRLAKNVTRGTGLKEAEATISAFLPVYIAWTIIVTFIFPLLFHFG